MASEQERPGSRQQRREDARQKRLHQQRLLRIRLALAAAVLLFTGAVIWIVAARGNNGGQPDQTDPPTSTQGAVQDDPEASQQTKQAEKTVIHIAAAGDLNVTDQVVSAGRTASGYDFGSVLQDVAPVLSNADLAIVNFEGNLAGEPYGSQNRSAPQELMQGLADAGVDMVQLANSCAIRNGLLGLSATLDGVKAAGMESLGAWASNADAKSSGGYTIREVGGLRIAIVAFTKGMDNLGLPEGSENCVNLLYTDYATTYSHVNTQGITRVLDAAARENPDFTLALLHWGSEYNEQISSTQEEIRDLMLAHGVDAIVGTHPHLVQKIDWDTEKNTLVAYSLGDFLGDAEEAGTNYSVILDLEITRDNTTGVTTLTNYTYTPIYTLRPSESGGEAMQVLRIEQTRAEYDAQFLARISQTAYDNMTYALGRISARISGES